MDNKIEALREAIDKADNIVFFGGAGVSTESGLPDFRGINGLYRRESRLPPEYYLNLRCLKHDTKEFFNYQRKEFLSVKAEPNPAHIKLAELERQGKLKAIITQNVDGLHQAAGSKNVIELHGNTNRCYCTMCHKSYDVSEISGTDGIPHCKICRIGVIRPDVVLYGEIIDKTKIQKAVKYIKGADMLIVGGTSLAVDPARGLVTDFKGNFRAIINLGLTSFDDKFDLVIHDKIGSVFSQL